MNLEKVAYYLKTLGLWKIIKHIYDTANGLQNRLFYANVKCYCGEIDDFHVVFTTDDPISKKWFFPRYGRGQYHEKHVTDLFIKLVRQSTVFVDVGANLGWYSIVASRANPQCKIFSFEIDNDTVKTFQKNISLNNSNNIKAFQMAVSSQTGVEAYAKEDGPSSNFKIGCDQNLDNALEVDSISLDDFFKRVNDTGPVLIKIDVEGAEYKVLQGMRHLLKDRDVTLLIEIHPFDLRQHFNTAPEEVTNLLRETGYDIQHIETNRLVKTNELVGYNAMYLAVSQHKKKP